jgi:hypothetical protein
MRHRRKKDPAQEEILQILIARPGNSLLLEILLLELQAQ